MCNLGLDRLFSAYRVFDLNMAEMGPWTTMNDMSRWSRTIVKCCTFLLQIGYHISVVAIADIHLYSAIWCIADGDAQLGLRSGGLITTMTARILVMSSQFLLPVRRSTTIVVDTVPPSSCNTLLQLLDRAGRRHRIHWHGLIREREGVAGGWKLRVSCGPVVTINPSKQEAKGGSDEPRP